VQPPGSPWPFATPWGANVPGGGQVLSLGPMTSSIAKGAFEKALENGVPVVVSVHVAPSGGEVRFTSFCWRQA
jgi:hypothetical protein